MPRLFDLINYSYITIDLCFNWYLKLRIGRAWPLLIASKFVYPACSSFVGSLGCSDKTVFAQGVEGLVAGWWRSLRFAGAHVPLEDFKVRCYRVLSFACFLKWDFFSNDLVHTVDETVIVRWLNPGWSLDVFGRTTSPRSQSSIRIGIICAWCLQNSFTKFRYFLRTNTWCTLVSNQRNPRRRVFTHFCLDRSYLLKHKRIHHIIFIWISIWLLLSH